MSAARTQRRTSKPDPSALGRICYSLAQGSGHLHEYQRPARSAAPSAAGFFALDIGSRNEHVTGSRASVSMAKPGQGRVVVAFRRDRGDPHHCTLGWERSGPSLWLLAQNGHRNCFHAQVFCSLSTQSPALLQTAFAQSKGPHWLFGSSARGGPFTVSHLRRAVAVVRKPPALSLPRVQWPRRMAHTGQVWRPAGSSSASSPATA